MPNIDTNLVRWNIWDKVSMGGKDSLGYHPIIKIAYAPFFDVDGFTPIFEWWRIVFVVNRPNNRIKLIQR